MSTLYYAPDMNHFDVLKELDAFENNWLHEKSDYDSCLKAAETNVYIKERLKKCLSWEKRQN